jgi:type VI secretion system protein ImpA
LAIELKDIDPVKVCGDNFEYDDEFNKLKQDINNIEGAYKQQMVDGVKGKKKAEQPPNWPDIKKHAEALLTRTIDLQVLICYLRALIALEGFSGLQDGLTLIKTALETRWDTIHPQLDPDDDNDPTERINILNSLCDHETLLKSLQQMPLLESKLLGRFNYRDISIASGKLTVTSNEKAVNQATIDGAVQDCQIGPLQQTFDAITSSLESINQLDVLVTDYVGASKSKALNFVKLQDFLKASKSFLATALKKKGAGDDESITDAESKNPLSDVLPKSISGAINNNQQGGEEWNKALSFVSTKSISGVINNSQDVIKALDLVCEYYKKNEPSSPIPLFVERAKRLVGKNFMEVLKDLAPTGIDEANVIFGTQHKDKDASS